MIFNVISSGSKGNAVLLMDGTLLIDCGVSFARLAKHVRNIKLVLLTHRHGDHFNRATVKKIASERPTLRWACCEWMVALLVDCGVKTDRIDLVRFGDGIHYGDLRLDIRPFELYHDVPNCGWDIKTPEVKAIYATDTGSLDGVEAKNYDLYLLEANHTTKGLEERAKAKIDRGEFAYEIRAAENHLSEEQAMNWLAENAGPTSEYVFLHRHRNEKDYDQLCTKLEEINNAN